MPTPLDPDTRERSEGATPNGGTYAIAYFRDARGEPCTKAGAAGMEVVEYDAEGEMVGRTYMSRPGTTPPT